MTTATIIKKPPSPARLKITGKNIKKKFDFASLGINLELRAYQILQIRSRRTSKTTETIGGVLLEEPPTRRPIFLKGLKNPRYIWTPWTYHYFRTVEFDSPIWWPGNQTLLESTSQINSLKCSLHSANHFNLSPDNGACYITKAAEQEDKVNPAVIFAQAINSWWMGQPNTDYGLSPGRALQYELANRVVSGARGLGCSCCSNFTSESFGDLFDEWEKLSLEEVNSFVEQSTEVIINLNYFERYGRYVEGGTVQSAEIVLIKPTMKNSRNKVIAKALEQSLAQDKLPTKRPLRAKKAA